MTEKFVFKMLTATELHPFLLQAFNRYQETRRAWVPTNGEIVLQETHFVDEWDEEKKARVIEHCATSLKTGGMVTAACRGDVLKGFALIEGQPFGSTGQYRELTYLHISQELRGQGIGRQLFQFTCDQARRLGILRLYIAAHPAEETQAFYQAMGCIPAQEVNPEIRAREPLDIQLELKL